MHECAIKKKDKIPEYRSFLGDIEELTFVINFYTVKGFSNRKLPRFEEPILG